MQNPNKIYKIKSVEGFIKRVVYKTEVVERLTRPAWSCDVNSTMHKMLNLFPLNLCYSNFVQQNRNCRRINCSWNLRNLILGHFGRPRKSQNRCFLKESGPIAFWATWHQNFIQNIRKFLQVVPGENSAQIEKQIENISLDLCFMVQ